MCWISRDFETKSSHSIPFDERVQWQNLMTLHGFGSTVVEHANSVSTSYRIRHLCYNCAWHFKSYQNPKMFGFVAAICMLHPKDFISQLNDIMKTHYMHILSLPVWLVVYELSTLCFKNYFPKLHQQSHFSTLGFYFTVDISCVSSSITLNCTHYIVFVFGRDIYGATPIW